MTTHTEYKQRLERVELFLEYAAHEIFRYRKTHYNAWAPHFNPNQAVEHLRRDLNQIYQAGDLNFPAWAANTPFSMAAKIEIDGKLLIAVNTGTTGASQPVVPAAIGGQVTDGTVTWERIYDSPITAWDARFSTMLTTYGITQTDYEHYNCLKPPKIWTQGATVAVGDVIMRREALISTATESHVFPVIPAVDTMGACLNSGPPTGNPPPPGIPPNYYEACENTWVPIPTYDSYTTETDEGRVAVLLFMVTQAGTLGDALAQYQYTNDNVSSITYDEIVPNTNGTAELRVKAAYVDVISGSYNKQNLVDFPEKQMVPCS